MHGLDLKIPPLALAIVTAIIMWTLSRYTPALAFTFTARVIVATSLAIAGVLTSVSGVASFRTAGTSINPLKPGSSSSLVRFGVYALTRNLYLNRFQIEPEERALSARFGQEFVDYRNRVRRWL